MNTQTPWKKIAPSVIAVATLAPALAVAQEWQLVYGGASRAEYTDNYFYVAPSTAGAPSVGPESAFTLSLIPFVAAVRRTETSEVKALVSIGANKAWGVSEEYLSASATLEGVLREERSTWTGLLSYARSPELQNVFLSSAEGVRLALAYTDTVSLDGAFTYRLTEQWSAGAGMNGSYNRYESVQDIARVTDDLSVSASGDLRYAFSDNTRSAFALNYVYSTGDLTRSDIVTARVGIAHRYSQQLAVSATLGWYWSDTRNRSGAPESVDVVGREDGGLFGAGVEYALSEATQFTANASQSLSSSAVGTISKADNVAVGFSHRLSDRLQGHVGATYTRTTFPGTLDDAYSDKTVQAEVGMTWRFAEHWTMDAGYRYERTKYSTEAGEPKSNVVFVSVAYNWPGASLTSWIGRATDSKGLSGAGPLSPRDFSAPGAATTPAPSAPSTLSVPEPLPFEPFTLP